jgi:hypothetical protein
MARRRLRLEFADLHLERRELLSHAAAPRVAAEVRHARGGGRNLFHHDGINGLVLHRSFVNQLNDRLANSKEQAILVNEALQAFQSNNAQLPVNPPAGGTGPTLDHLLTDLTNQVVYGVSVRQVMTNRPNPSSAKSIRVAPLAPDALVPFAVQQIQELGAKVAATPPVLGPDGTLKPGDITAAVNAASNAILNAIAESSVHPLLFQSPSDFYLSPDITFTTSFNSTPASAAPGYFVRGPGGTLLPGAPVHPYVSF